MKTYNYVIPKWDRRCMHRGSLRELAPLEAADRPLPQECLIGWSGPLLRIAADHECLVFFLQYCLVLSSVLSTKTILAFVVWM